MAGNVIHLSEYKSTVRSDRNRVAFPTVYRARGRYCVSDTPGPYFYTLAKHDHGGYHDVDYVPIQQLSDIDTGWVIVRHHPDNANVEGYLDAAGDFEDGTEHSKLQFFRTPQGIFSLLHRPPSVRCEDKLLAYVTRAPDPNVNHPIAGPYSTGWCDHYIIHRVDGSVTEDPDILIPPELED